MTPRALPVVGLLLAALAVACSGGAAPTEPGQSAPGNPTVTVGSNATTVNVVLTSAGCVPDRSSVPAGGVVFSIVNEGADAVSEVELLDGEKIVGERENLAPGLSGTFALELKPGTYQIYCPGATTEKSDFVVLASNASGAPTSQLDELLAQATQGYDAYVREQVGQLVTATNGFAASIEQGDVDNAKSLYGPARLFYERIEPVAESFGDLDPQIDGRIDDAASPDDFTGFHRLERALWADGNLEGMAPVAHKLVSDVGRLNGLVAGQDYQPAQLANGAAELLDEISASKVTGEEERYSHVDLLDFQGNLEGARKSFDLLTPALNVVDPDLAATITGSFMTVESKLAQHRSGDGYISYTELSGEQTRDLAQAVNALAEPMSQVAAKLVSR